MVSTLHTIPYMFILDWLCMISYYYTGSPSVYLYKIFSYDNSILTKKVHATLGLSKFNPTKLKQKRIGFSHFFGV